MTALTPAVFKRSQRLGAGRKPARVVVDPLPFVCPLQHVYHSTQIGNPLGIADHSMLHGLAPPVVVGDRPLLVVKYKRPHGGRGGKRCSYGTARRTVRKVSSAGMNELAIAQTVDNDQHIVAFVGNQYRPDRNEALWSATRR